MSVPSNTAMTPRQKIFEGLFIAQVFLALAYGLFLQYLNANDPQLTERIAEATSWLTQPIARLLPICRYAEVQADPHLYITPVLIRHIFPLVAIIGVLLGVPSFGWCKPLVPKYEALRRSNAKSFDGLMKMFFFLAVLSLYMLFYDGPMVARFHLSRMNALGFELGLASPALFFCSVWHLVAMHIARRRSDAAGAARTSYHHFG